MFGSDCVSPHEGSLKPLLCDRMRLDPKSRFHRNVALFKQKELKKMNKNCPSQKVGRVTRQAGGQNQRQEPGRFGGREAEASYWLGLVETS